MSAGGKQALYNAALVLFGEGDEVITHSPGWPTLVEQIKLADATPVLVHTHADEGFRISAAPFIAAFTPRTRGVVINSPGQPDRRADAGIGAAAFLRKRPRAAISGSSWISATRS